MWLGSGFNLSLEEAAKLFFETILGLFGTFESNLSSIPFVFLFSVVFPD